MLVDELSSGKSYPLVWEFQCMASISILEIGILSIVQLWRQLSSLSANGNRFGFKRRCDEDQLWNMRFSVHNRPALPCTSAWLRVQQYCELERGGIPDVRSQSFWTKNQDKYSFHVRFNWYIQHCLNRSTIREIYLSLYVRLACLVHINKKELLHPKLEFIPLQVTHWTRSSDELIMLSNQTCYYCYHLEFSSSRVGYFISSRTDCFAFCWSTPLQMETTGNWPLNG